MNELHSNTHLNRNQTLILVEGKHEKGVLLTMLLRAFPEIPIRLENVHIYSTDIYDLYHAIEKEYGVEWYDEDDRIDVNLPLLISRREGLSPPLDNRVFTNVLLMFDFEHHDNNYSDDKVKRLQHHFSNATEDGILYINYPMIEAYQHMERIPDPDYLARMISISYGKGSDYKNLVKRNSAICGLLGYYEKSYKRIKERASQLPDSEAYSIREALMRLSDQKTLYSDIETILCESKVSKNERRTLTHTLYQEALELGYLAEGVNFWQKVRYTFSYIINQNIEKAWKIQQGMEYDTKKDRKTKFYELDWNAVLEKQLEEAGRAEGGMMWVLCTSIVFLGEYKFYWSEEMQKT
ncbi:MAG: hypothetical protein Q4A32_01240 [Lachnospiraceae bacterium]|nr:hypothetical protein [Lachnospiraceae bacterium]